MDNLKRDVVLQSNTLTNASAVQFTKLQLNCFLFILSKLKEDVYIYNISTSDMLKFLKTDSRNITKVVDALDKLLTTSFHIPEEDDVILAVTILQHFRYVKNLEDGSCINFMVAEMIRPYLFNLKSEFTILNIAESLALKKKNSYILYTFLRQWKTTGKVTTKIEDLRKLFDNKGLSTGHFIIKMQESVEDIQKFTSLKNVKILKTKKGRTITHLDFTFDVITKKQIETLAFKTKITKQYNAFTDLERNMFNRLNTEFGLSEENSLWTIQTCVKHKFMDKLKVYLHKTYLKNKEGGVDFITTYVQNGIKREVLGIDKK